MARIYLILIFLIGTIGAPACDCKGQLTVKGAVKAYDFIAVARVINKEFVTVPDSEMIYLLHPDTSKYKKFPYSISIAKYRVVVEEILKGKNVSDTITIYTGLGSGDCGYEFLSGSKYIIYGIRNTYFGQLIRNPNYVMAQDIYWTSICSRTTSFNTKELNEIKALTKSCPSDKLYGEWLFIEMYKGRLSEIDTLKKVVSNSRFGTPIVTFNKNGTFIADEGDYTTKGNFEVDTKKCAIRKFGDHFTFEITYLDDQYLVLSRTDAQPYSYFYKRNTPARLKLRMIIEIKGADTMKIQKFDEKQRLIFWRSTEYGMSQVLTYTYDSNILTNYVWSHSNFGFIISDYVYDESANTRTTFSYETKMESKDRYLNTLKFIQNVNDLKKLKQYQNLHKNKHKFLKEIAFYRDTLLIKEIEFNAAGNTSEITNYTYENNKLKSTKTFEKHKVGITDMVYKYDENGNEIQWEKIMGETSVCSFKKIYLNNLLVEEQLFKGAILEYTTKYEYSNGLLKSEKDYDPSNNLNSQKDYFYNSDNILNKIVSGERSTYYIYE